MKILLTDEQLREGVRNMAARIAADHGERPLTIVAILTGSLVLVADLIRLLEMPIRVGLIQASSYRDGTERGRLSINSELLLEIEGRDVLLVDDIFDTGHTLKEVISRIQQRDPRSIQSAVLLRKEGRQEVSLEPDYVAFEIPDEFVVGYGLDYQDAYRNLPYLAAMEAEDLADHV